MVLPSIFHFTYTKYISVPCFQCIIYPVVPCNLFLGRTSLFLAPPRSPYILPSCLLQPSYYVKYVITVSKEVHWCLKDGYTLSNTLLTGINVVFLHTKISKKKKITFKVHFCFNVRGSF